MAYKADFKNAAQGIEKAMFVASIWRRVGQRWENSFSMDSPAD